MSSKTTISIKLSATNVFLVTDFSTTPVILAKVDNISIIQLNHAKTVMP